MPNRDRTGHGGGAASGPKASPRRRRRRATLLAALAASLLLSGCVVTSTVPPGPSNAAPSAACGTGGQLVPLRVVEAGASTLALVEVTIRDQGPFLFALDTGASSSVVDLDVATRLGLPRAGTSREVTGVTGEQTVPLADVESWRVADVELGSTRVALVDLPDPHRGPGLEGLLGSDVLSRFGCVVVDYANRRLELPAASRTTASNTSDGGSSR